MGERQRSGLPVWRLHRIQPGPSSMSDREILLRWLAAAARRSRWQRRLPELARLACALAALALLDRVLAAAGAPDAVVAGVRPLLLLAALTLTGLFAWRCSRRVSLADTARAADGRAALNDELRSAHWFAQPGAPSARDAAVELL